MVAGSGPTAEGTDDYWCGDIGNTVLVASATADGVGSRLPGNETKGGIAATAETK